MYSKYTIHQLFSTNRLDVTHYMTLTACCNNFIVSQIVEIYKKFDQKQLCAEFKKRVKFFYTFKFFTHKVELFILTSDLSLWGKLSVYKRERERERE